MVLSACRAARTTSDGGMGDAVSIKSSFKHAFQGGGWLLSHGSIASSKCGAMCSRRMRATVVAWARSGVGLLLTSVRTASGRCGRSRRAAGKVVVGQRSSCAMVVASSEAGTYERRGWACGDPYKGAPAAQVVKETMGIAAAVM